MPRGELKGVPDEAAQAAVLSERCVCVVGDDAELVDVLMQLEVWKRARSHVQLRRGRPFDVDTLIAAAELLMRTETPLRAGSGARATKLLIREFGYEEDRARGIVDRLAKASRRVCARKSEK